MVTIAMTFTYATDGKAVAYFNKNDKTFFWDIIFLISSKVPLWFTMINISVQARKMLVNRTSEELFMKENSHTGILEALQN